jgi:eukaryotic-like serine/threonine-protein kinase
VSPEVHRLFQEACTLPPGQRTKYLQSQTADAEVHREVLSLLAHDALAEPFFAEALESAASSVLLDLDLSPGTRIGSFTIVRMLGRGGMGAVYLAKRTDGSFEQTVAIKVIQSPNPMSPLLARFQQERQILARLNHPNIARLLDGGETPAGLPYFVMEYVPGQEIDAYCGKRALDLRARLRLFLHVSAAVQYAHENLVVHRDLKPGNILVGDDGEPKLLDFGIAKVLDPLSGPTALTSIPISTRVLTPEYASPEQVRGDAITTAADIYSLGAVLYRLLTGRPPHVVEHLSPLGAARRISEQDAPVATNVPTDVGAILQKALHTDPRHRYRSADEFSTDIQRFLDGRPVLAASDSVAYRTAKFLRRHWIPVVAISAIVLALTAGAGVAIWQGRRAERRFSEVRQLSNKFLFEFEGAIHNVSGTTKARELVIKTAQEYLDRLATDAGRDPELIHELAEAYHKLGNVQGSPLEGNTGDSKAALASYRRAVALRDSVGDARASATNVRVGYLTAVWELANAEAVSGDAARALPLCEKAVSVAQSWIQNGSSDSELLTAAANAYSQLSAHQRENGYFEASVASAKHSLALQQRVRELRPEDEKLLRSVAVRYWAVGSAQKVAGHPEEAVANFTTTVDLMRQVTASNPANAQNRRELLGASWLLAACTIDLLHKQKKGQEQALPLWEDAWRIGTQLLKEDPANALVEADVTTIALGLGSTLQEVGRPRDALTIFRSTIERQQRRYISSPDNRTAAYYLALLQVGSAVSQKDLRDLTGALSSRRAAIKLFDQVVTASPANFEYRHQKALNLQGTGEVLVAQGDYSGARAMYRDGLEIAEQLPKGPSMFDPAPLIAGLRAADSRAASAITSRTH